MSPIPSGRCTKESHGLISPLILRSSTPRFAGWPRDVQCSFTKEVAGGNSLKLGTNSLYVGVCKMIHRRSQGIVPRTLPLHYPPFRSTRRRGAISGVGILGPWNGLCPRGHATTDNHFRFRSDGPNLFSQCHQGSTETVVQEGSEGSRDEIISWLCHGVVFVLLSFVVQIQDNTGPYIHKMTPRLQNFWSNTMLTTF